MAQYEVGTPKNINKTNNQTIWNQNKGVNTSATPRWSTQYSHRVDSIGQATSQYLGSV